MCPMSSWKLSFFKKYTIVFQNSRFDMFSENYGTFWLFPCLNDTDETNGKFYYWLNNIFQGVFFLKPMKQIGNSIFTNFDFWHTLNQPWPTVRRAVIHVFRVWCSIHCATLPCYLVLLLDHDIGICGGSSLFLYIPKGVITFLVLTKGGQVSLWRVLLVTTGPLR